MGLPGHARRIVVGASSYRWIVSDADAPRLLRLIVQADGGAGQRLVATLPYRSRLSSAHGWQQTSRVGSATVRAAIARALAAGWSPRETGADHELAPPDVDVDRPPHFRNGTPLWILFAPSSAPLLDAVALDDFVVATKLAVTLEALAPDRHVARLEDGALGVLATFAWWSSIAADLRAHGDAVVPSGTPAQPWHALDQGHELLLWATRGEIFVAAGATEPSATESPRRFDSWFRAPEPEYHSAWRNLLAFLRRG